VNTLERRTRILFLCVGNSCRSQIAEAMARHQFSELIEAESAGLAPLGRVASETLAALQERGIRAEGLYSKSISDITAIFEPEIVVNISGHPVRNYFPQTVVVDWEIADPYGSDPEIYRRVCAEVEDRLNALVAELQRGSNS
jgi:arsenate reductase (thioredoxin)